MPRKSRRQRVPRSRSTLSVARLSFQRARTYPCLERRIDQIAVIVEAIMTKDGPLATWGASRLRADLGRALQAPCTARELSQTLGKDQSNIKKAADRAADDGLLTRSPARLTPQRGRKPLWVYSLSADQRDQAASAPLLATPRERASQQPVRVAFLSVELGRVRHSRGRVRPRA